jgi:superoxide dismutase
MQFYCTGLCYLLVGQALTTCVSAPSKVRLSSPYTADHSSHVLSHVTQDSESRLESEHATRLRECRYYIDYLNARPAYMDIFVEKLINWDKVEERYTAALA